MNSAGHEHWEPFRLAGGQVQTDGEKPHGFPRDCRAGRLPRFIEKGPDRWRGRSLFESRQPFVRRRLLGVSAGVAGTTGAARGGRISSAATTVSRRADVLFAAQYRRVAIRAARSVRAAG